jgi:hypothetical protein
VRQDAEALGERTEELRAAGVEFQAFARRVPSVRGIRYKLCLHVLPVDGFDNFAWVSALRTWGGRLTSVEDAKAKADKVLDAYAAGLIPPGPAFDTER